MPNNYALFLMLQFIFPSPFFPLGIRPFARFTKIEELFKRRVVSVKTFYLKPDIYREPVHELDSTYPLP